MKKILLTGGAGFIGTHLTEALLSQGHQVEVFDLCDPSISHFALRHLRGDVRNFDDVSKAITPSIDAIFHFAAIVSVPECEKMPNASFETNLLGTQNILNRLLNLKPHKNIPIFFASSAAVYGSLCKPGDKLKETEHLPAPLSFYGLHKFASEQSIKLHCEAHGLLGLSFRFFNVYGPGQKVDSPYSGVISKFKQAIEAESEITLFREGLNSRDFIPASEIARACTLALNLDPKKLDGSCLNLCTGKSTTIKELMEMMAKKSRTKIKSCNAPPRPGDIEHSCGDPSKAKELLGFSAKGLSEFLP